MNGPDMARGDGSLARVTYLPGVIPPPPVFDEPVSLEEPVSFEEPVSLEEPVSFEEPEPFDEPESTGERSARAANISMRALTRRGMSSSEMTELLRARELGDTAVEGEVARLEGVGLLDDRELADTLVRTLHERKGLGRSAITAELRRRRVDPEAIEHALGELDGDDELSRARELAIKRAPQLRSLDSDTARRRLGAFLMRKGYPGSVVSAAVTEALASNTPTARGPRFQ